MKHEDSLTYGRIKKTPPTTILPLPGHKRVYVTTLRPPTPLMIARKNRDGSTL